MDVCVEIKKSRNETKHKEGFTVLQNVTFVSLQNHLQVCPSFEIPKSEE